MCDCSPTKLFDCSFSTCLAESLPQSGVLHQYVNFRGQITRKFVRIEWFKRALLHLLYRHQKPGLAIDNHFFNTADSTRHHRRFTGHRFQINDSKRLIDGWTAENGGMAIKLINRRLGNLAVNPDNVGTLGPYRIDRLRHFVRNFRGIRSTGAKNHLGGRLQITNSSHQMDDPLLTGNPTYE